MANIKEINRVAHKYDIPLVFDVARWAENCYFIKMNEEGYADKSIAEIATEMFSYCDAFSMSAKKDGHANMGGIDVYKRQRYRYPGAFHRGYNQLWNSAPDCRSSGAC